MKFRISMISVVLLGCVLSLYGQQAGLGPGKMSRECPRQTNLRSDLRFNLCKPVLDEAKTLGGLKDLPRNNDKATYITFDVPAAVNGTFPTSINLWATVVGSYNDASYISHGFLRDAWGNITTFDVPGDVNGTSPGSINLEGTVTGTWFDVNYIGHGFVRSPDGSITSFDVPGDVNGTSAGSINLEGTVTGTWFDVNYNGHGFVRSPEGTITTFDPEGSTSTFAGVINLEGTIAGGYFDANGNGHGFLRDHEGTITTFDVPGSSNTALGGAGINPQGAIAGSYFQPIAGNPFGGNFRGMLRHTDGTFETWDAGPMLPCCNWTFSTGIAPDGTITGYDDDGYNVNHGFVRAPDGNVTSFNVPGSGTGNYQGTTASAISDILVVTGHYVDSSGVSHGFLRIAY